MKIQSIPLERTKDKKQGRCILSMTEQESEEIYKDIKFLIQDFDASKSSYQLFRFLKKYIEEKRAPSA